MNATKRKAQLVGGLMIAGIATGIVSVVPAIDSAEYLSEAAQNVNYVVAGGLIQFTMAIIYLTFAVLLYPILENHGKSLAIGFISLRLVATILTIMGAILLASLLAVSQEFVKVPSQDPHIFEIIGHVLKTTRDHTNHVYMILVLCSGNILMYMLFIKSRLVPAWISIWGLASNSLSAIASVSILFQIFDVISIEYIALNVPTALLEIVFALWLLVKGFDVKAQIET